MWRKTMWEILVQQKVAKALSGDQEMPKTTSDEEKQYMQELAYNTIILYVAGNVLRYVDDQDTASKVLLYDQVSPK